MDQPLHVVAADHPVLFAAIIGTILWGFVMLNLWDRAYTAKMTPAEREAEEEERRNEMW